MFQFLGDIVSGGWDAIGNVAKAAGGAIEPFTSPFFPAPQKVTTLSQITQPIESTGGTYRPTTTEMRSAFETLASGAQSWLDPEELEKAKRKQSMEMASQISSTDQSKGLGESIVDVFEWTRGAIGEAQKVKTVVDELIWDLGLKKRPEEGTGETHLDTGTTTGADVSTILKGFGSAFWIRSRDYLTWAMRVRKERSRLLQLSMN